MPRSASSLCLFLIPGLSTSHGAEQSGDSEGESSASERLGTFGTARPCRRTCSAARGTGIGRRAISFVHFPVGGVVLSEGRLTDTLRRSNDEPCG